MLQGRPASSAAGPVLVALGGVVTAIGTVLKWYQGTIDLTSLGGPVRNPGQTGLSGNGKLILPIGIALIAIGVGLWFAGSRSAKLWLGVLALVGGLVVGVLGISYAASPEHPSVNVDALAAQVSKASGKPESEVRPQLEDILRRPEAREASVQIGLWLTIVGGFLAAAGGLVRLATLMGRRRASSLG